MFLLTFSSHFRIVFQRFKGVQLAQKMALECTNINQNLLFLDLYQIYRFCDRKTEQPSNGPIIEAPPLSLETDF